MQLLKLLGLKDDSNKGKNSKRNVQPSVIIWIALVVGLMLLVSDGMGCDQGAKTSPDDVITVTADAESVFTGELLDWQRELSEQLSQIMAAIEGAGEVTALVQLQSGPTAYPVRDEEQRETQTTELDSAGGSRTVTETQTTLRVITSGTGSEPVWKMKEMPEVASAIIIATGAADPVVRQRIHRAAMTLLGLPAHRIVVMPGGDKGGY